MFVFRLVFSGLLWAQVASATPTTDVLSQAAAAYSAHRYDEAVTLYGRGVAEAIHQGECRTAAEAISGLRESAYWSRRSSVLDTLADSGLWEMMHAQPACSTVLIVELALGYEQSGQKEKALALLEEATKQAADDPKETAFLRRARALLLNDVSVELTPVYVDPPVEPSAETWEAAFPVWINRPDQVLEGKENWSGPGDASADLRAGRIAQNLYLWIKVTDDVHMTVGDRRDRVVISLDASRGSGAMLRRHPFKPGNPMVIELDTAPCASPRGIPGCERGWEQVQCIDGGYIVVACFPKGTIGNVELDSGNRYALDVTIEDVDPGGSSILRWMELTTDPRALYWAGVLGIP